MAVKEITRPLPPHLKGRKLVKVNARVYADLIKHLLEGIYNCEELAELTGLHYVTVLDYTRELHKAKAVHIGAWEKDARGRDVIKIYRMGEGRDAKRQKISAAERQRRYYAKQRQMRLEKLILGDGSVNEGRAGHDSEAGEQDANDTGNAQPAGVSQ